MRADLLVLALAISACNPATDEPSSRAEARTAGAAAAAPIEQPPRGVPHGGFIQHLAVTEGGDAAVTLDNLGSLRLWPALDGTREPVAFSVNGAQALAITRTGDELVVGVLDEAGAAQLLRFSKLGTLRGRTQLPGETAIDELVAIERGVLVARADHTIERYDANGGLRGRIAVAPGESVGAIAVRHGAAAALIVERETQEGPQVPAPESEAPRRRRKPARLAVTATENGAALRWIQIGEGLAWGPSVKLPGKLAAHALALAPGHARIAVLLPSAEIQVLSLTGATPVPVDGPKVFGQADGSLGFVDDDHVVRVSGATHWWTATVPKPAGPVNDPWKVDLGSSTADESVTSPDAAYADGLVVAGLGANLVLQGVHETRYLGWMAPAAGNVTVAGTHLGVETTNTHVVWLDRGLERESDTELADAGFPSTTRAWWLDPNHAVIQRAGDDSKSRLELIDLRHRELHVDLGMYAYVQRVEYEAGLGQVAVVVDGELHRFALDLEHDRATELPMLALPLSLSTLRLLDPERSDGLIAVISGYDDDGQRVVTYRARDAKPGKPIRGKKGKELSGGLVGIGPNGVLYVRGADHLTVQRAGKTLVEFPQGETADLVATDTAGARIVGIHGTAVTLWDAAGQRQWTRSIWGAQVPMFSGDGSRVILRTSGGLLALDAATGERVAATCGLAFGLMTKTPASNTLNVEPVCEDPGS